MTVNPRKAKVREFLAVIGITSLIDACVVVVVSVLLHTPPTPVYPATIGSCQLGGALLPLGPAAADVPLTHTGA